MKQLKHSDTNQSITIIKLIKYHFLTSKLNSLTSLLENISISDAPINRRNTCTTTRQVHGSFKKILEKIVLKMSDRPDIDVKVV